MNWRRIQKENSIQPSSGTYRDDNWKVQIAEECYHRCVYCAIHEARFGGIRNFHIEHYKPKSLTRFRHLENDIKNLFLACSICNCFKKADWPNDPNHKLNVCCYPDPSLIDYSTIIELDNSSYQLRGKKIASRYFIERLFLNRPQLLLERRYSLIITEYNELTNDLKDRIKKIGDYRKKSKFYGRLIDIISAFQKLLQQLESVPPYTVEQVKRQK